jgi:ATP-dependent Clp protease protease subunit
MKKILTLLLLLPTLALAYNKPIELTEGNTINFNQAFDAQFVAKKQIEAINLCSNNKGSDIYIVLYTPGGSISAGQLFFDTVNALPCFFHTVTIFAASMGYQTVQALGKRYILQSGTLMSHRASLGGLGGELGGELDSILNFYKQNVKEMELASANRVGITLEKYKDEISDELWLTAEQAVKRNHADEIVRVTCHESLLGTHIENVRTMFGTLSVEFSNCPIITAPLGVNGMNIDDLSNFKKHQEFSFKNIKTTL